MPESLDARISRLMDQIEAATNDREVESLQKKIEALQSLQASQS